MLLDLTANIIPGWKGIPGALAYYGINGKHYITLTTGVNVMKLCFFIADAEAK
jgi:hypothetical protein